MSQIKQLVGLVDPIRTAKSLLSELKSRNIARVIIESGLAGEIANPDADIINAAPSVEVMAENLRKIGVTHLIGCVDPSILYTDQLCALMGLPFNGLRLSRARRNKVLMNEAVRKAGLNTPLYFEAHELTGLVCWLDHVSFPIVVKPVLSGGSDDVYLCGSLGKALDYFHKIYHSKDLFGCINNSVLFQEFIEGIEYAVDSVSFNGTHVVIDIFQYQKGSHNGREFIYEKERYLKSENPISDKLQLFAQKALDALEFRTGASHMEVKLNAAGEIFFIEVGPRLNGDDIYKLVQDTRADGKSQVEYTIDSVLGHPYPAQKYKSAQEGVRVHLISHYEGNLIGLLYLDDIRALKSFRRIKLNVEVGQKISKTTDLTNGAGWVDLANADLALLRNDERRVDTIISRGVLAVEHYVPGGQICVEKTCLSDRHRA
jgi:hypothetical protein